MASLLGKILTRDQKKDAKDTRKTPSPTTPRIIAPCDERESISEHPPSGTRGLEMGHSIPKEELLLEASEKISLRSPSAYSLAPIQTNPAVRRHSTLSGNPIITKSRVLLTPEEKVKALSKVKSRTDVSEERRLLGENSQSPGTLGIRHSVEQGPKSSETLNLPQVSNPTLHRRSLTIHAVPPIKDAPMSRSSSICSTNSSSSRHLSVNEVRDVLSRHGSILDKFDNRNRSRSNVQLDVLLNHGIAGSTTSIQSQSENSQGMARPQQLKPLIQKRASVITVPEWLIEAMKKNEDLPAIQSKSPLDKWRRYTRYLISIICSDLKKAHHTYVPRSDTESRISVKINQLISLLRTQPDNREASHIHYIEKHLRFVECFVRLSPTLRQTIAKKARYIYVEAGRTITHEGHPELYQYMILDGTCEQEELHIETASYQKRDVGPRNFIDEFIPGISSDKAARLRTKTVRAVTDVQAIFVPVETLLQLSEMDAERNIIPRMNLLKSIQGMESTNDEVVKELALKTIMVSYPPSMTIVTPNDRDYIYFVMSGSCRVTRNVPFVSRGMGIPTGYYEPGVTRLSAGESVIYKKMAIGNLQYGDIFPRPVMNRKEAYKFHAQHKDFSKLNVLATALLSRASSGIKAAIAASHNGHALSMATFDAIGASISQEAEDYMAGLDFESSASNHVDCIRISRQFLFATLDVESLSQITASLNEGIGGTSLRQIQEAALQKTIWDEFKKEVVSQARH